ncbi:MAG: DUF1559 domain-containing protein [Planctomycetes bacterium]|nr:DUF1559 domain-containing protein [Planctomycetota bacterium]
MNRRPGFTPFELIVTMTLLLMLVSFLIPLVERVRNAASDAQSRNNLRNLALAVYSHTDTFRALPPVSGKVNNATGTIHFHLLPYLDEAELWKKADGSVWNNDVNGEVVGLFLDNRDTTGGPSHKFEDRLGTTNYAANWMVFKTGKNRFPASIPDGVSQTLMFAERYQICNDTPTAWGYPALYTWAPMFGYYNQGKFQSTPRQADCDPTLPQSIASPAILVAICDSSVRALAPSISPETWWYATDPADGMPLARDWND